MSSTTPSPLAGVLSAAWFATLPPWAKVIIILALALGAGWAPHAIFQYRGASAQEVVAIETRVDSLAGGLETEIREIRLELREIHSYNEVTRCLQLAELERSPWQRCLK